jgi:hypothetical protein
MNYQCRKCGEDAMLQVSTVYNWVTGWHLVASFPFVRYGVHRVYAGDAVRCTRHGCGRYWVITSRGVQETFGSGMQDRAVEAKDAPRIDDKPDPRPAGQIEREYV